MRAGGVVFAVVALLGLHGLLLAVLSAYLVLKVAGGAYLAWLGVRIWASARQLLVVTDAVVEGTSRWRSLALGFTTQVSNPKAALVYASAFATFLPAARSPSFDAALLALVFTVEAGWYAVVALTLSTVRPRDAYLRCKVWVDRVAAGVMVMLGIRLVWSTLGA
jgi:threonine/homoserine/homoserine lactone efflux protein